MEGQCWRETRNHQQNQREHSQALSELYRQADRIDARLKPNKNQKQKLKEALPILEKRRNEFLIPCWSRKEDGDSAT